MTHIRSQASAPLLGALVAALALLATACGGGGAKAAATPAATKAPGVTAFVNCLQSHGYTPSAQFIQRLTSPPTTDASGSFGPAPGGGSHGGGSNGGGGTTRTTLDPAAATTRQQALQACQPLAPAGFRGFGGAGGSPAAQTARLNQLKVYASCLADHGYTALKTAVAALPSAPVTAPSGSSPTSQPATAGGPSLRNVLGAINRSDPAFVTANQSCQAVAPRFGGGGLTSTTTAPGA